MISHIFRIILFNKKEKINFKYKLPNNCQINKIKIIKKEKNEFDSYDPKSKIILRIAQSQFCDENISFNNNLKKRGNEIYRINKNFLDLILLCEKQKVYFLSPCIKKILSSTPRIETSVFSPNNNFTLGEWN